VKHVLINIAIMAGLTAFVYAKWVLLCVFTDPEELQQD
jgi:hypothetical protein